MAAELTPLFCVGGSLKELRSFPDRVKDKVGYALFLAQSGDKHRAAKPLSRFGGAGVIELVEDNAGDTYPAVCTVRYAGAVYVLPALQKKSNRGSQTPAHAMQLIRSRLKLAEAAHHRTIEGDEA